MDKKLTDLQQRYQALKEERQSWEKDWRLLAEHFLPRKCRLEIDASQTNKGGLRHNKLDSTAFYAMRDLAAGLHGGLTSPARPWFALTMRDQEVAKDSAVRKWLDDVTERMRFIYHRSNFYNAISSFYAELATFGTAFMFEMEDPKTVVRFVPLTAGEYCLDTDASGRVDTVFRSVPMTLRQLEQEFGREKLPENLRNMLDMPAALGERFVVVHAVFPASQWQGQGVKGDMPFASVYYLEGQNSISGRNSSKFYGSAVLREGGFEEFPGFGVRWDITGNDVYGKGPAYDTLADSVLLQQMSQTMLKALHKEIDPPLAAPAGFENVSLLPGAVNPVNPLNGSAQTIYPIMQVRHNIQGTYEVIAQIQNKVREGLFNNLFRMLLNSDRRQITAREVAAREEEKLILIGPVLERLNDEFFIPVSNRTFNLMARQNWLPPAPEEIQDMELSVEFVSILAQAQKMVATGTVEKFAMFVGNVAGMYPEALDSIEVDAMIDNYADYLGVPASMLKGQDKRDEARAARAQQQEQMQQAQAQMALAEATQKLGSASTENTALGALGVAAGGLA